MKGPILGLAALFASVFSLNSYAVNCAGLPVWNSTSAYGGTTQVQEAGKAYKANWWSQGHSPAANSGQWQEWTLLGSCDGAVSSVSTSKSSSASIVESSRPSSSSTTTSVSSSSSSSSVTSTGGNCASPQFVSGTSYSVGQLVKNAGSEYRCTIAG